MNRFRYPTRPPLRDIFHGDPFKIQSYNFRYAEKPCYLPQHCQRTSPPQPQQHPPPPPVRKTSFQTFFVNPKFGQDAELTPQNRRQTNSRPRFLQEFQTVLTPPLRTMPSPVARSQPNVPVSPQLRCPSGVTNSPLLRSCCQMREYLTLRRGQSISTLGSPSSHSLRANGGGSQSTSESTCSRRSNDQLPAKRGSGCAININICSRDSESEVDNNVSIRIEGDACLLNNTDTVRPELERIPRQSESSLAAAFGIDKRLSKFNVSETKPRTSPAWELQQREQTREKLRQQARERERQFREDLELQRLRELQEERERARQRQREREHRRLQDRQRDLEHLRELEAVRERQRLQELERESQRQRQYHQYCILQQELHRQRLEAKSTREMSAPPPVVSMTSHLYTVTSDDRLPGMAYCDLSSRRGERPTTSRRKVTTTATVPVAQELPTVCASSSDLTETAIPERNSTPSSPTPSCSAIARSPSPCPDPNPVTTLAPSQSEKTPAIPEIPDRSSSCSSNGNVHVTVQSSGSMAKRSSALSLNESKQLNGRPPILTSLNNMPIRITTSRRAERQLDFSLNHIRVRGSSPMTREAGSHRRSHAAHDACQVNINLYSDPQRWMRI